MNWRRHRRRERKGEIFCCLIWTWSVWCFSISFVLCAECVAEREKERRLLWPQLAVMCVMMLTWSFYAWFQLSFRWLPKITYIFWTKNEWQQIYGFGQTKFVRVVLVCLLIERLVVFRSMTAAHKAKCMTFNHKNPKRETNGQIETFVKSWNKQNASDRKKS